MLISEIILCLFPLGLLFVLLFHVQIEKGNFFREDFWSLSDAKVMQGVAAIFIILHHLTQFITEYGAKEKGFITGMNSLGILFTSIFFFFSGYGLFVSYQTKENYLKDFLRHRLPPVLLPFMLTNLIYTFTIGVDSMRILGARNLFTSILGFTLINTNAWFIVEILILYIAFFIIFRKIKNDKKGILLMSLVVGVMIVGSLLLKHDNSQINGHWFMGEWWYNTTILFVFGMMVAKWKEPVVTFLKKHYNKLIIFMTALFVLLFLLEEIILYALGYYCEWKSYSGYVEKAVTLLFQILVCVCFVAIWLMINMKCKFDNRALRFLASISLEIFLIHDWFKGYIGMLFDMPDVLFFAIVLVCSGFAAKLLSMLDQVLLEWIRNYFSTRDYIRTHGYAEVTFERKQKITHTLQIGKAICAVYGVVLGGAIILCSIRWYHVNITPKLQFEEECQMLSGIEVGDEYYFGRYEMDFSNDQDEQIPWIVVELQEDKALLLSKYVLGPSAFNQQHQGVYWSSSTLRTLLNETWYEEAFIKDERNRIVAEESTGDYVFLFSVEQAYTYFKEDEARIAKPSKAARNMGVNVIGPNKTTWWWLRDSDVEAINASIVTQDGAVDEKGNFLNCASGGVRPAIWISLK